MPHFLLPIASWRHGKEVAKFKNMWTTFQVNANINGNHGIQGFIYLDKIFQTNWEANRVPAVEG